MTIWMSVNGSHSQLCNPPPTIPNVFPSLGFQANETMTMRNERWQRDHKALAGAQHQWLQLAATSVFYESVNTIQGDMLIGQIVNQIRIKLETLFNPLLANLSLTNVHLNVLHNGFGYEATVSYSLSGSALVNKIHLSTLSPSQYESLVP